MPSRQLRCSTYDHTERRPAARLPQTVIAMQPIQLFDPESSTFTYLLVDPHSGDAVIIDPVDHQLERDLAAIRDQNARLLWTIETHAHADHITSAAQLIEHTGAQAATPAGCGIQPAARQLQDGDVIPDAPFVVIVDHAAALPTEMAALLIDAFDQAAKEWRAPSWPWDSHPRPFHAVFLAKTGELDWSWFSQGQPG